jgi:uncharacterized damage-inducible protein DinB
MLLNTIDEKPMETVVLANHIKRTVLGPMWHGPALDDVLAGVTAPQALARPIASAHSIWQIVLHVAVWAEVARARLGGDRLGELTEDEDWPAVGAADDAGWTAAVARMREAYRNLARDVRHLDAAILHEKIAGLEYSRSDLLHGVIEHGTYHGGQIALLKKALGG